MLSSEREASSPRQPATMRRAFPLQHSAWCVCAGRCCTVSLWVNALPLRCPVHTALQLIRYHPATLEALRASHPLTIARIWLQGIHATICMPESTPTIKVDAVRALGGHVQLCGESYSETQAIAQVRHSCSLASRSTSLQARLQVRCRHPRVLSECRSCLCHICRQLIGDALRQRLTVFICCAAPRCGRRQGVRGAL